jgi:hypothetical protein
MRLPKRPRLLQRGGCCRRARDASASKSRHAVLIRRAFCSASFLLRALRTSNLNRILPGPCGAQSSQRYHRCRRRQARLQTCAAMHLFFLFCSETLQLEPFRSAAHVPQDACVHTSQGRVLRDFPSAVVLPEFPGLGIIVFSLLNHPTGPRCCTLPSTKVCAIGKPHRPESVSAGSSNLI